MNNEQYWTQRMERLLLLNEQSALEYQQQLKQIYQRAIKNIETEMEAFFQKYAKRNRITYVEARQLLTIKSTKKFKEQQLNYLAEVKRLGMDKKYEQYLKQLSAKTYITKLDEILANIRYQIETLYYEYEIGTEQLLTNCYENSYYGTTFSIYQNLGVGVDFTAIGNKQLKQAVQEKWLEENYSSRIWKNKQKLIVTLQQLIPQEFVRGRSLKEVSQDLAHRMEVSYSNAEALVRTEVNQISNRATVKSYQDSNIVEKFQFLATLDNRTSDICIVTDKKVFPLKEAQIGITVPPLHVRCRSTTVPFFENDKEFLVDRIARDENGKSYKVGKDVTYEQWAKEHTNPQYYEKVLKAKRKYQL